MKNFILGLAIIIITIAVINYGINTFYPQPEYEDFCDEFDKRIIDIEEWEICTDLCDEEYINDDTAWDKCINICDKEDRERELKSSKILDDCYKNYETARESYSKNIFLITFPLGIIIIILGTLLFNLEAVGAGLMGGGLGTIIYGITGYWRYSENWLKFLFSLIALAILIWLTYYFNKKGKKK